MMSLRISVLSGYASQGYILILGMAVVPLYVKYMGAEAYGLVGFFTMLQAWFTMLDLGLSATASRETSLYKSHQLTASEYSALCKGIVLLFLSLSISGSLALWLASSWIAQHWLDFHALSVDEVVFCVQMMALSVGLRLMGGVYKGIITGAEWLPWLNAFSALVGTIKFVGVMASMWFWGFTAEVFFIHQLAVGMFECGWLWFKARSLVPHQGGGSLGHAIGVVWTRLKFMLSMAFVSVVWVMASQLDKLVLSGVLNLHDYGYFTVAMVVANGITFLTGPVSGAVMPRMTRLNAENAQQDLIMTYRKTTRMLMALVAPVSMMMAAYARELLLVWTGNPDVADHASPVLRLYALGNGVLAMGAFAYYLQYAKGQMRYHVYSSILFIAFLMPALTLAAVRYGAVGAGWVWLVFNLLYLLLWVAFVHHKLAPGLHMTWLCKDGVLIVLPSLVMVFLLRHMLTLSSDRWIILGQLAALSLLVLMTSLALTADLRRSVWRR